MGRSQRQKGKRGERATATEIRDMFPEIAEQVRRGWQSRRGDDDPDVVLPPPLDEWWLENKCGAQPNPRAALAQAIEESRRAHPHETVRPLVVIRDDRKEPFAVVLWRDMLKLLRRAYPAPPHPAQPLLDALPGLKPGEKVVSIYDLPPPTFTAPGDRERLAAICAGLDPSDVAALLAVAERLRAKAKGDE